ncbi:MAG: S-layer homology domain-containing protein [Ruminiclostridium sp.]|nr:S-layer homology domain-containing protein [Ruminiclostridium sp.]
MKKKLIAFGLAALMLVSVGVTSLAVQVSFPHVNRYTPGQFTDVPANTWYTTDVANAYELGLVKGCGEGLFAPDANITLAETITIASRIHAIYHNGSDSAIKQGSPWYQAYIDYAINNGIISSGMFDSYLRTATRAEFAAILAKSLPEEALPAINDVTSVPDVDPFAPYAAEIYLLYNAGILTGGDKYGTFSPSAMIQRSAVAAIVSRMADSSMRKIFQLEEKGPALYPMEDKNSPYWDLATAMPEIAFSPSAPAELEGSVYYVTGTVTGVSYDADLDPDANLGTYVITLSTENGPVVFVDMLYLRMKMWESVDEADRDLFPAIKDIFDHGEYTYPALGEYVCIRGAYICYDNLKVPALTYGVSELYLDDLA